MARKLTGDLRFVDVEREPRSGTPPTEFNVQLNEDERVVAIETIKDSFGYAWARVWIAREVQTTGREQDG